MYKEEEIIISVTPELIQQLLPTRIVSSKKGDNGIVLNDFSFDTTKVSIPNYSILDRGNVAHLKKVLKVCPINEQVIKQ
jgi:hypothetical protein